MIRIELFSDQYKVRKLTRQDIDEINQLMSKNSLYYEYCPPLVTRESIREDMGDKYYVGFYQDKKLAAVMDLIDGYPKAEIAYIGFFMMNLQYQGRQIGTAIIGEVIDYLQSTGKTSVRLAIDKGNPQSTYFWKKNGFEVISEADVNGWTKLVAERKLT